MNTSVSKRPRPMCRLVQGWVSVFGDGEAAPRRGFGSRHAATCDCCRQFFNGCATLESSLRREAVRENADVTPGLDRQIIEAVHRSARVPSRRRSPLAAFVLVGATAAAALAVMFLLKSPALINGPVLASAGSAAGNSTDLSAGGAGWSELPPAAGAILDGEPLQHEADAVYSDARSAIGFLALNFLPSVPQSLTTGVEQAAPRARTIGG